MTNNKVRLKTNNDSGNTVKKHKKQNCVKMHATHHAVLENTLQDTNIPGY